MQLVGEGGGLLQQLAGSCRAAGICGIRECRPRLAEERCQLSLGIGTRRAELLQLKQLALNGVRSVLESAVKALQNVESGAGHER